MRRSLFSLVILLFSSSLIAGGYTFVDRKHPFHVDTDVRAVQKASFSSSRFKDSHVTYADSYDTLYYSFNVNDKNSLSLGLGYSYLQFDWDKNPRFRGDRYQYGNLSLTWISTSLENWRWVITNGITVD